MLPPDDAPTTAAILALAGVRRGQVVLDLSGGTGLTARAAAAGASREGLVICVQSDPEAPAPQGPRPNVAADAPITWVRGRHDQLPLGGGVVDTVLHAGVSAVDQLDAMLVEVRRVSRGGARLVVGGVGELATSAASRLAVHGFELAHLSDVGASRETWHLAARRDAGPRSIGG